MVGVKIMNIYDLKEVLAVAEFVEGLASKPLVIYTEGIQDKWENQSLTVRVYGDTSYANGDGLLYTGTPDCVAVDPHLNPIILDPTVSIQQWVWNHFREYYEYHIDMTIIETYDGNRETKTVITAKFSAHKNGVWLSKATQTRVVDYHEGHATTTTIVVGNNCAAELTGVREPSSRN